MDLPQVVTRRLPNVDIEKYYQLCALYAIERSGQEITLEELMRGGGVPFDAWEQVDLGDIVCWEVEHQPIPLNAPTKIQGPYLLAPKIELTRHFGVFEGDDIVSDLTFSIDHDSNQWPHLRMRNITALRYPDRIFTPKVCAVKVK